MSASTQPRGRGGDAVGIEGTLPSVKRAAASQLQPLAAMEKGGPGGQVYFSREVSDLGLETSLQMMTTNSF